MGMGTFTSTERRRGPERNRNNNARRMPPPQAKTTPSESLAAAHGQTGTPRQNARTNSGRLLVLLMMSWDWSMAMSLEMASCTLRKDSIAVSGSSMAASVTLAGNAAKTRDNGLTRSARVRSPMASGASGLPCDGDKEHDQSLCSSLSIASSVASPRLAKSR